MTTTPSLRQSQDLIQRIISDVTVYRDQVGVIDDLKAEKQKAQASLDVLKQNVKGMQINFDEVKREYDKILAQAWEKQNESERLDKEIKEKRATVAQLEDYFSKARQRLG
jgi:chromosome segregation ATPase